MNTKIFETLTHTAEAFSAMSWGEWGRAISAVTLLVLLLGILTKKIKFGFKVEIGSQLEK